jgi:hypothetical protein
VPDIHSTHWASIEKLEMLTIIATVIARSSINYGNNLESPEDIFETTLPRCADGCVYGSVTT